VPPNLSWGDSRPYDVLQRTLDVHTRRRKRLTVAHAHTGRGQCCSNAVDTDKQSAQSSDTTRIVQVFVV